MRSFHLKALRRWFSNLLACIIFWSPVVHGETITGGSGKKPEKVPYACIKQVTAKDGTTEAVLTKEFEGRTNQILHFIKCQLDKNACRANVDNALFETQAEQMKDEENQRIIDQLVEIARLDEEVRRIASDPKGKTLPNDPTQFREDEINEVIDNSLPGIAKKAIEGQVNSVIDLEKFEAYLARSITGVIVGTVVGREIVRRARKKMEAEVKRQLQLTAHQRQKEEFDRRAQKARTSRGRVDRNAIREKARFSPRSTGASATQALAIRLKEIAEQNKLALEAKKEKVKPGKFKRAVKFISSTKLAKSRPVQWALGAFLGAASAEAIGLMTLTALVYGVITNEPEIIQTRNCEGATSGNQYGGTMNADNPLITYGQKYRNGEVIEGQGCDPIPSWSNKTVGLLALPKNVQAAFFAQDQDVCEHINSIFLRQQKAVEDAESQIKVMKCDRDRIDVEFTKIDYKALKEKGLEQPEVNLRALFGSKAEYHGKFYHPSTDPKSPEGPKPFTTHVYFPEGSSVHSKLDQPFQVNWIRYADYKTAGKQTLCLFPGKKTCTESYYIDSVEAKYKGQAEFGYIDDGQFLTPRSQIVPWRKLTDEDCRRDLTNNKKMNPCSRTLEKELSYENTEDRIGQTVHQDAKYYHANEIYKTDSLLTQTRNKIATCCNEGLVKGGRSLFFRKFCAHLGPGFKDMVPASIFPFTVDEASKIEQ